VFQSHRVPEKLPNRRRDSFFCEKNLTFDLHIVDLSIGEKHPMKIAIHIEPFSCPCTCSIIPKTGIFGHNEETGHPELTCDACGRSVVMYMRDRKELLALPNRMSNTLTRHV